MTLIDRMREHASTHSDSKDLLFEAANLLEEIMHIPLEDSMLPNNDFAARTDAWAKGFFTYQQYVREAFESHTR